jgi:AcrR family transcriptional regulator
MGKIDKRQAIIEAARTRFRHYGIRKTAMQEIAEDMHVAVGTLYLYFKNKDELILGCAEQFADAHKVFADELLRCDLPADEKLRRYVISRFRAVKEVRLGTSHTAEIARVAGKLNPAIAEQDNRRLNETVVAILAEGIKTGVFRSEDPAKDAEIFLQTLAYFVPMSEPEQPRTLTEAKLCQTLDWFMEKWGNSAGSRRRAPSKPADSQDLMPDRPGTGAGERRRLLRESQNKRV